mgnify:CR=1 FL=1
MTQPSPWWQPHVHADRRSFLQRRGHIRAALRRWFEARAFVEVDPCILQASPGNEAHLHAFATDAQATDGTPRGRLYLHTSPEFACKKLLAAGETRLFAFAHVFRNRERGPVHHPEFTMLEWYRAGEPYEALNLPAPHSTPVHIRSYTGSVREDRPMSAARSNNSAIRRNPRFAVLLAAASAIALLTACETGPTPEEIAQMDGVSESTVKRQWRTARAWLRNGLLVNWFSSLSQSKITSASRSVPGATAFVPASAS